MLPLNPKLLEDSVTPNSSLSEVGRRSGLAAYASMLSDIYIQGLHSYAGGELHFEGWVT